MKLSKSLLILSIFVMTISGFRATIEAAEIAPTAYGTPWYDVRSYTSLSTAIAAIGPDQATLLVPNTQTVTSNIIIPANVTLNFLQGGELAIGNGVTVTCNGHLQAGLYRIFSLAGTGKISFATGSVEAVFPEWWGAKADGTTDDTGALQKAVDAFPNGGVVSLSGGTYLIKGSGPIKMPSNTTLQGKGASTTLKRASSTTFFAIVCNSDYEKNTIGNENISISGITFDCNGAASKYTVKHGIALIGVNNALIFDCKFVDISGDGVYIGSTYNTTPRTNYSRNIRLIGNYFNGNSNGRNGISIIDAQDVTIVGNNFENVASKDNPGGIDLEPDWNTEHLINITIIGNVFRNCRNGIQIWNKVSAVSKNISVGGNVIDSTRNSGAGIIAFNINGLTISNNSVFGSTTGIYADRCSALSITANSIHTNAFIGIWVRSSPMVSVSSNTINETGNDSYRLDNSSGFTFIGNIARRWDRGAAGYHYGLRGNNGSIGGIVSGNSFDGPGVSIKTEDTCSNWNIFGNYIASGVTKYALAGRNMLIDDIQAFPIISFSNNEATPSVSGGKIFKTSNTTPTTITMFNDGMAGQEIKILVQDSNTRIGFKGTNLKGNGGADWKPSNGDWMECLFDGTKWYCSVHDATP